MSMMFRDVILLKFFNKCILNINFEYMNVMDKVDLC